MIQDSDLRLVHALVHDAFALCAGAGDREIDVIQEELAIAEALITGTASDDDRKRVAELVHPQTNSQFRLR